MTECFESIKDTRYVDRKVQTSQSLKTNFKRRLQRDGLFWFSDQTVVRQVRDL